MHQIFAEAVVWQFLCFAIYRDWLFVQGINFCDFLHITYNWPENMFVIKPKIVSIVTITSYSAVVD